MGEVKVLIQNFFFHCVLGKVKIYASVSSRTGGRSMFYKHLLLFVPLYDINTIMLLIAEVIGTSNSSSLWYRCTVKYINATDNFYMNLFLVTKCATILTIFFPLHQLAYNIKYKYVYETSEILSLIKSW